MTRRVAGRKAVGIDHADILCDVANGAVGSTPASGRLTDHLAIGVLTWTGLIHRDIVDDVIRECGKREKRSRLLPAHVVMYYVLALNLFLGEAYEEVMRQLVNGLRFLGNWRPNSEVPSTSAISRARTRLGEAPMKLLFERIAVPMARAGTRGSWLRGRWPSTGWCSTYPPRRTTTRSSAAPATPRRPARSPRSGWSRWASAAPTESSTPRSARSAPCGCREPCHVMRPGRTRVEGRQADLVGARGWPQRNLTGCRLLAGADAVIGEVGGC